MNKSKNYRTNRKKIRKKNKKHKFYLGNLRKLAKEIGKEWAEINWQELGSSLFKDFEFPTKTCSIEREDFTTSTKSLIDKRFPVYLRKQAKSLLMLVFESEYSKRIKKLYKEFQQGKIPDQVVLPIMQDKPEESTVADNAPSSIESTNTSFLRSVASNLLN